MKYSLRSLMVVVTLIAVVLGGRIEYLRRMAAFHEIRSHVFAPNHALLHPDRKKEWAEFTHHLVMARRYKGAMTQPWIIVDETPDSDAIP